MNQKLLRLWSMLSGECFTYGGMRWIVLNHDCNGALCLAADVVGNEYHIFDADNTIIHCIHNNFKHSTIREYLNGEFLDSLVAADADRDAFLVHQLDLTTNDGLDEYGIDEVQVGLLTCNQYRKYRKILPENPIPYCWWTCTPNTIVHPNSVYVVGSQGILYEDDVCNSCHSIRPLCRLRSDVLVSNRQ